MRPNNNNNNTVLRWQYDNRFFFFFFVAFHGTFYINFLIRIFSWPFFIGIIPYFTFGDYDNKFWWIILSWRMLCFFFFLIFISIVYTIITRKSLLYEYLKQENPWRWGKLYQRFTDIGYPQQFQLNFKNPRIQYLKMPKMMWQNKRMPHNIDHRDELVPCPLER